MQAHKTNKSDNVIELAKGSMDIQHEMKPTFNKVLINTTFPVNSVVTINQENFHDMEEHPHGLNINNLTIPPNSIAACSQDNQEQNEMEKPFINSLSGNIALPFKCTKLQPTTGSQDWDLSRHMNMIYNPTSISTDETHKWSDTPETYNEVDWNVFVLEKVTNDHLQHN